MCVREYDLKVPYGVISNNGSRITSIDEKPVHSFFINAGIYVLSRPILDSIDGKKYLDMPCLLEERIKNLKQVNMFPIHEYWLDIGQIEQFNQAQVDITTL